MLHVNVPVHAYPFPLYPDWHVHVKFPSVLLQTADTWQPPLFIAHSSMSTRHINTTRSNDGSLV